MNQIEKVLQHIRGARLRAVHAAPYLATALWRLRGPHVVHIPNGYMGVSDNWVLYIDVDKLVDIPSNQLAGALRHEVWHLLRRHAQRMGSRHRMRWNWAGDLSINSDLQEEGVALPPGVLYPGRFNLPDHQITEWYYENLPVPPEEENAGSGSCADGVRREYENDSHCPAGLKDDEQNAPGEMEKTLVRRAVAKELQAQIAKKPGTIPGNLARWADETLAPPQIPWQQYMAGVVRGALAHAAGMVDYSYCRPSRRQSVLGPVIMPSLRRPVPVVAVVFDTSGSMGAEEGKAALSEVKGVLLAAGAQSIHVFGVDSEVHSKQRITNVRQVRVAGGGGTDMGAGLAAAAELHPRPAFTVVLTDGYTPWPAETPRCGRIIVCLVGDSAAADDTVPSWARTVRIHLQNERGVS